MMPLPLARLGNRFVGGDSPCYVIAEIGLNHNGDMALAEQLIVAAKRAGADAVKFQNYRTEDFLSDRTLTHRYRSGGREVEESQYDFFKRCELPPGALATMKTCCDRVGIDFISTPTNEAGVRALVELGAVAIKNGSDYLGHLPLIQAMARTGLPVILSTGMADAQDIAEAVQCFRTAGGRTLLLLHCVSVYPSPLDALNLRRMATLRECFRCPVGFSDHSEGVLAAALASGLGACVIEKHFTLDQALPGPDHAMSADPVELALLVQAVRDARAALGQPALAPAEAEAVARTQHRLSCVAASELGAHHVLAEEDIAFRRPGLGLRPALAEALQKRVLRRAVPNGHVFEWSDFV